ncbi:MAG TPA: trypsin-like peptidase domain-containing protein [Gaiellaceae bacterium]|nr:trypsin-like peptidase domain-containing protein [Gaiellaceae bacterium]
MKRIIAIVLAAAAAGGIAGALIGIGLRDGSSSSTTVESSPVTSFPIASSRPVSRNSLTPEQIYRADAPGVVVIADTMTQNLPPTLFTPGRKEQVGALGSGFVVDRRGDIITNDHVVAGATAIRVGFANGASYPAKVVGTDASTDLAVVRVSAPRSALEPLALGDSTAIQVGDPVYAIGNPFGLDRTTTAGIVSATGRDIASPNGLTIANAIQTDAPINHGNSGGPLLDRFGRVVGINAQIQGGTVNANVGIGFAIPSDTAKSVAEQLISRGHADHAWLGVEVATIDPSLTAVVRGLPSRGVLITRVVKGSPAARAGLRGTQLQATESGLTATGKGDVIVGLNGHSLDSTAGLVGAVAARKPGDKVTLEVVRGGARRSVEVTLGNVRSRS